MTADLDHLHKVVSGEANYRRCGKTFARCHELASVIELGDLEIVCYISYEYDKQYLYPMILDVLKERGVDVVFNSRDVIRTKTSNIRFITTLQRRQNKLKGLRYTLVNMGHHD